MEIWDEIMETAQLDWIDQNEHTWIIKLNSRNREEKSWDTWSKAWWELESSIKLISCIVRSWSANLKQWLRSLSYFRSYSLEFNKKILSSILWWKMEHLRWIKIGMGSSGLIANVEDKSNEKPSF